MSVKTDSVERLIGSYHAWAANGASRAPAWLKNLREGGLARFGDLGFPNMKQEAWRFTSVAPIAATPFELANPAAPLPSRAGLAPFLPGAVAPPRPPLADACPAPSGSTTPLPPR